ncbi:hypothetical protein SAMN02745134_02918 [Clostridium acidisoli DSM 12555]|uniref:Uncharacterized protein n=1 Tax=Clostridium acidisoli DSM 12555 TaxID=1121291 RepID=A0A1W1XS68_9CLOT|nr:hypothetical protein [Clostridium acidisoli]SMC26737.1 hypothetical protein SAMN02745134_02918 [Clostridium acidisoli DSM 12555]
MKDRKGIKGLGLVGVFLGLILSKLISAYGGDNVKLTVISGICVVYVVIVLLIAYKGYKSVAFILFIVMLPIFIGVTGAYLDNLYIMIGSILLFFIVLFGVTKYLNSKNK